MPPFLRRGHPVGKRVHIRRHVTYFCRCQECLQEDTFNPLANDFVAGKQFGKADYQRHQRIINRRNAHSHVSMSSPQLAPRTLAPISPPELLFPPDLPPLDSTTTESVSPSTDVQTSLRQLQLELISRRERMAKSPVLIFLSPPQPSDLDEPPLPSKAKDASHSDINNGLYALDYGRRVNQPVLEHLHWLQDITLRLDAMSISLDVRPLRKELLTQIEEEISRVEYLKAEEWHRQFKEQGQSRRLIREGAVTVIDTGTKIIPSEPRVQSAHMIIAKYYHRSIYSEHTLVYAIYLLLAVLHLVSGLSMDSTRFAIAGVRTIVELALEMGGVGVREQQGIIANVPADVSTILNRLDLAPDTHGYVCCAKCFACYDLDSYPDHCIKSSSRTESPCGALLHKTVQRKSGREVAPVRKYLHHDMRYWMARMLCRLGEMA
ncbi:hypothetical protein QCA50_016052 [Cerrena zonata]|uniref:Uncharacterized protein n=1 Tax=Cerrena zonata TaxID=2478898 RepID=A0AAW0FMI7_9APHY